ncbi:MAG: dynamin family protein [Terriglobia bacterium]|jgi:GTP-binding protein EngB required for normal cell division
MAVSTKARDHDLETAPAPREADAAGAILRLAALAGELRADRIVREAGDLAARVSEGRFYVACIGQSKRGKSTLINALIGEAALPAGIVPVTAVPTVVRLGDERRARIQGSDGSWREIAVSDLNQYVSEERNPENAKRVSGVEVFVPSPLLATGMCLVDTPGLGSVFTGNTAATQAFVPHIDAALVVVGADPPLAGEELALVESIGRQVPNLIVVLNKADRTTESEKTAAREFTRQVLEKRLQRSVGQILEVSAVERLEKRGPTRDWEKLIGALERLGESSGRQLVLAACARGLGRIGEQLLVIIGEERQALQRPIEESERRIAAMKETIAQAEGSMRDLGFLLTAEQCRLSDIFVGRHKAFLARALPEARHEFQETLRSTPPGIGPSYRRNLLRAAQEIARRRVLPWLRAEQMEAEKEYRHASLRFTHMGNEFLRRLADAGLPELSRLPHALDPEAGFRYRSEFTFRNLIEVAQPASPLRWLADLAIGLVGARRWIGSDACDFLIRLLEINSTRVQSDILNRVQESRSRLEVEIRKLLHEIRHTAQQALSHARDVLAEGAPALQATLGRLDVLEQEIRNCQSSAGDRD